MGEAATPGIPDAYFRDGRGWRPPCLGQGGPNAGQDFETALFERS